MRNITVHALFIVASLFCLGVVGAIGVHWVGDPHAAYVWTWLGVGLALKVIGDEL